MNPENLLREVIPGFETFYEKIPYVHDPAYFGRRAVSGSFLGIEIDAEGFRVRPNSLPSRNTRSDLLLGDSVTFGVGILDSKHLLSSRLEVLQNKPVLDLSSRAFRIEQQSLVLLNFLAQKTERFERVLLWGGYVDLLWWLLSGGCQKGYFGIEGLPAKKSTFFVRAARRLLKGKTQASGRAVYWKKAEWRPAGLEEFARYLAGQISAIASMAKGSGSEFLFLLQPMQLEPDAHPDPACRQYYAQRNQWIKEHAGDGVHGFEDLAAQFRAHLLAELGRRAVKWIDTQALVEPQDFYDQVHLKPAGLEKIAAKLSKLNG
jgi:hypothetical protein